MVFVEAEAVGIDEMLILQAFFKNDVSYGIRQCCVGGGKIVSAVLAAQRIISLVSSWVEALLPPFGVP